MSLSVAIVHNAYGKTSGEEIVIGNLASLLAHRGITVLNFSRSSEELEKMKLGKIRAFFSGIHNPFSANAFGRFLKEKRPDVVHIHNLYPFISPSILPVCTAQSIPVVMTIHNFRLACPNGLLLSHGSVCHRCMGGREYWCVLRNCENDYFKSTGYALRTAAARMMRQYYDHVNHFICLTGFQRDVLVKEGLPRDRVSVLPNPVNIKIEEQSVHKDENYVLFAGRVSPEKGIASLFKAAGVCSDIPFVVAGNCEAMPQACQLAPANVKLLGAVPPEDIGMFYKKARIFVLPSLWYEGFPTVLLEAMSHGLPIVCSRIGGLPEIVDDGKTGLLFEPGNADDLANRIRALWQNPDLCKKMGEAGLKKLREQYAAGRLMDNLIGIYNKVTSEKMSN